MKKKKYLFRRISINTIYQNSDFINFSLLEWEKLSAAYFCFI